MSEAERPERPLTVAFVIVPPVIVVFVSWSMRWLGANAATDIGVEAAGPENEVQLKIWERNAFSAASSSEWVTVSSAEVAAPRTRPGWPG